jgi:hypothetical protein
MQANVPASICASDGSQGRKSLGVLQAWRCFIALEASPRRDGPTGDGKMPMVL